MTAPQTPQEFYEELHRASAGWYRAHPRDEQHPPLLILQEGHGGPGTVIGLQYLFNDDAGKSAAAQLQRVAVGINGTTCAALVLESWSRRAPPGTKPPVTVEEHEALRGPGGVANQPDRVEVLVFSLLTEHQQALMMCRLDRKRRALEWDPFQWLEHGSSGRFVR